MWKGKNIYKQSVEQIRFSASSLHVATPNRKAFWQTKCEFVETANLQGINDKNVIECLKMLRRVKILHRDPKERARKAFGLFPLFHCDILMILFTRPLRRLCLPILVHNLCCHHSGKRKVQNDVYPSLEVRLNSNISGKSTATLKIWERRTSFFPVHATHRNM